MAALEPEPAVVDGISEVVLIPSKDKDSPEEEEEKDELFGGDDEPLAIQPENDEGNEEYKLQLINPSPERFVHLVTQCQFRVSEGSSPSMPLSVTPSRLHVELERATRGREGECRVGST